MRINFLRWRRWRARAKHYQRQAAQLEVTLRELREDFEAEVWRNRAREDSFVSAAVMGARGMFGVPPRTGPAIQRQAQPQPFHPPDPFDTLLTGADKLEFQTIVLPDARRAGVSDAEARRHFLEDVLQRRQSLNDEPLGVQ
jgi:hypothetical protein